MKRAGDEGDHPELRGTFVGNGLDVKEDGLGSGSGLFGILQNGLQS